MDVKSISDLKSQEIQGSIQTDVLKKQLDQQEEISKDLIESAVVLPPGKGEKINTVA